MNLNIDCGLLMLPNATKTFSSALDNKNHSRNLTDTSVWNLFIIYYSLLLLQIFKICSYKYKSDAHGREVLLANVFWIPFNSIFLHICIFKWLGFQLCENQHTYGKKKEKKVPKCFVLAYRM